MIINIVFNIIMSHYNDLPNEIVNNIILEYLTIYDNKSININIENKRKKIIHKSIIKINNRFSYYMIQRKYNIEYYDDSYYIPKKYWKLYYPLCDRKYFLKLVNKQTNLHNNDEIKNIYNKYLKNPKNNLTLTFNKIIDLLYQNELFNIGW